MESETGETTSDRVQVQPSQSLSMRRPQYSSSYGQYGSPMSMGMGMGMRGMGMGMGLSQMGSMGMNQMGQGIGGPNGFQQEYQGVFHGLRNVLQISFAGISLFAYGKIFGGMALKIGRFLFNKAKNGVRWVLAYIVFNKYSTKIMNGVVTQIKSGGTATEASSLLFKGLLLLGMLGVAVIWFMLKSANMEEEEHKILMKMLQRRKAKIRKQRELDECIIFYSNILRL